MLTVSPNLQDFPRNDLHVLLEGNGLGFERGVDGIRDPEAEVLERDCHLGAFAWVEIGTQLVARDACRPFDLQHTLCRHRSLRPLVDGLIANTQKIGELLNAAGFIDCFLDA